LILINLTGGSGPVGSVAAERPCRTAQPAKQLHLVRADRGAIQVLRRQCPEPARRHEATQ